MLCIDIEILYMGILIIKSGQKDVLSCQYTKLMSLSAAQSLSCLLGHQLTSGRLRPLR